MADLVEFGERRLGGLVYKLINWSRNSNETRTLSCSTIARQKCLGKFSMCISCDGFKLGL